jgi:hypothetical protein
MPRNSPFSIKLTRRERAEVVRRSTKHRSEYRDVIRAKIVLLASKDWPMISLLLSWILHARSSASGASVSTPTGYPVLKTGHAMGGQRVFPPVSLSKSKPWLVSCRRAADCP